MLGLEPNDHKLYQTDWLEEPVQLLSKEDRNLREAGIKQGELLVLRDKDSVFFQSTTTSFINFK